MQNPSEFFQALYSQVTHGLAEIRLLHKSGDIKLAKKIYRPATEIHNGNFDYLGEVNTEYHVYHRVNVSQDPRSQKADITQVVALWLEIDSNLADIPECLTDYPLPPTMLLHSGSGYHAYWLLKTPLVIENEAMRFEVERTLEGMILAWGKDSGGDIHTRDITRILRTPFYRNVKDKYAPDYPMCRVIWYDDSMGDRYKFSQLHKQYAPLGANRNQPIIRRSIPVIRDGSRPKWIMDYLEHGAAQGERNQRLFAVARWFNDVGDKSSQAESELMARGLADGLEQHEAMNTIRSAWSQTPNIQNALDSTMQKRYALGDKRK
jgi:hypothetical protein